MGMGRGLPPRLEGVAVGELSLTGNGEGGELRGVDRWTDIVGSMAGQWGRRG